MVSMSWRLCPGSHVLAALPWWLLPGCHVLVGTFWRPSLDIHVLAAYIVCRTMSMWVPITASWFFKSLLLFTQSPEDPDEQMLTKHCKSRPVSRSDQDRNAKTTPAWLFSSSIACTVWCAVGWSDLPLFAMF